MKKLNPVQRVIIGLVLSTAIIAVVLPLMFFLANAFSNGTEIYDYPKTPLMSFRVTVEVSYDQVTHEYIVKYVDRQGEVKNAINSSSSLLISHYYEQYFSVYRTPDEIDEQFEQVMSQGTMRFTYSKNLWHNFKTFFFITSKADEALVNSIVVVFYTILISLTLGSMSGYAIARYRFKGKDQINVFLLIVRMFPTVGISIPLAVILIRYHLFDTMLGLAILYSLPNIALTAWITSSIFVGINRELEEASLVFGGNGFQTFMKITLPLALPAMAASSMYAFLTAWNDTISALILTNDHPTLALAVYQAIGDNTTNLQYAAAGSIILIIPALIFTFVVRKYVNQMWGSVSV